MRNCCFTLVLLICGFWSQGQVTFNTPIVFGGLTGCTPTSVLELPNGFLMISWGRTESIGPIAYRTGLIFHKFDFYGNMLWEKIYNQPGKNYSLGNYGSLVAVKNGYLICGDEGDSISEEHDYFLAKFDTAANLQWMKVYPHAGRENCWHGSLTNDQGYIIIGQTLNSSSSDYYVVKTDSNGNLDWQKDYGDADHEIGQKIHQTPDGGYIVSGTTTIPSNEISNAWVLKLDGAGTVEWSKEYGTAGDDAIGRISLSENGGYYLWGRLDTLIYNSDYHLAATIIRLDADGEIIWRKFFNHKKLRNIGQLRELSDGNIIAIGEHQIGSGSDSSTAWIAKLNSNGDILWERFHYGPVGEDSLWGQGTFFNGDFQQTNDSGFIIAGTTFRGSTFNHNLRFWNPWIVKLDSNGCFGPDSCGLSVGIKEIQQEKQNSTIVTYPNPFTTQTLISIKTNSTTFANAKIQFHLFDASGKLLQTHDYSLNQYGYCEFYLYRNQFPSGIYVYTVTTQQGELGKGKLIVE